MLLPAELLVSDLKCSEEVVSGILASRLQALVQSPKHIPPQSTVGGHCKRLLRFAVLPAEDLPAPTGPSSVCGSRWPVQERQRLQKGRPDTRPGKGCGPPLRQGRRPSRRGPRPGQRTRPDRSPRRARGPMSNSLGPSKPAGCRAELARRSDHGVGLWRPPHVDILGAFRVEGFRVIAY